MSVIIRLQNLPLTASSIDIRNFFHGLGIPDGGVHIVGGPEGDAFIAFSTDEDARQAMRLTGQPLKGSGVSLLLSSRNEMYKVIEQARLGPIPGSGPHHHQSLDDGSHLASLGASSPPSHHLPSQVSSSTNHHHHHGYNQPGSNSVSSSMSPTSSGSSANDYLRNFAGALGAGASGVGRPQADLSTNPALLFSTMSAIPSATLGGGSNAFLAQQQQQQQQSGQQVYHGLHSSISSPSTQQHQAQNSNAGGLSFGGGNNTTAAAVSAFANGNPFLVPPPSLGNMNLPFPANLLSANAAAAQAQSNSMVGLTTTPANTNVLGLSSNVLNTTMAIAGQHQPGTPSMNPFGNPPPRMSLMNNGGVGSGPSPTNHQSGVTATLSGTHAAAGNGPRPNNNNFGAAGGMNNNNAYGAGVGAINHGGSSGPMGMGNRPHHMGGGMGNRPPFSNMANNAMNKERGFQLGAIPSGRLDMLNNMRGGGGGGGDINVRERQRSRSRSRERREGLARRRRSRSRERDRANNDRRRKRSNSRSKSRDRTGKPTRRDSRDKRNDPERRSRSDSSPDKSSQDSSDPRTGRGKRDHEPSPTPTSTNTTTDEWPGAKLTGIPSDASYREIKEFIRAEVMGGSDGVVRLYDEGVAFLKLQNASEFPRVYKSNGRKLRGSAVTIEGITMEIWTQEYKLNKSRIERDIDREKEEREREFAAASARGGGRGGGSERDNKEHHIRSERHNTHHNPSANHHRSSRFSSASHQSSCIAIRGLAPTITKHELCTRYLHDTPCHDIVLIAAPTPTNRHSVTAFVQFESAQVAQGIIDSIVRSPLGTTLVVESCDVDDLQKAKARTSGGPLGLGSGRAGGAGGPPSGGMIQDAKSIFELDLGLDDETTTVIMKGAPPNITERDVFDFFSDIGLAPMNVRILYDTDGQCSGQVICEFPDNNKAKRATTKDGMLFGRGQISVSLLPSRNTTRGGGGNAGEFGQSNNNFLRNPVRPGLLGPPPLRGQGGTPGPSGGMSRFPTPTNTPNIFEQALQQQSGPVRPNLGGQSGGGRGSRGPNPSGGERMSRFSGSNTSRNDFRQNGMGRGRNSHPNNANNKKEDSQLLITEDDMALFNKKGCVIGLENIPYKASMDDILQYLEEVLKIRIAPDRIIRRYDDMQKPTGDARVAFDTEFEAKLACDRLSGTYMWKRPISAAVIE